MIKAGEPIPRDHTQAIAQERHDSCQVEQAVKVGATNVNAGAGQYVGAAVRQRAALFVQANGGEVGCAPSDVHDQGRGFFFELLLVVQRRSYGLQLKADVAKAGV